MADLSGNMNVGGTSSVITAGTGETSIVFFIPVGAPMFNGKIQWQPLGSTMIGELPIQSRWINMAGMLSEGDQVWVVSTSGVDPANNSTTDVQFFLRTV